MEDTFCQKICLGPPLPPVRSFAVCVECQLIAEFVDLTMITARLAGKKFERKIYPTLVPSSVLLKFPPPAFFLFSLTFEKIGRFL